MSTTTITAQFKLLSKLALNAKGEVVEITNHKQVFDHLVNVEWLSGPKKGEMGLLLCSHYCRWPQELLAKADFIEGCFTPHKFAYDKRLTLGFHPMNVTSWNEETLTLQVKISQVVENECDYTFSRTFQREWAIGEETIDLPIPNYKRIIAVWRLFCNERREDMTPDDVFLSMEERFLEGNINLSAQAWSYALTILLDYGVDLQVWPDGSLSSQLPEYKWNCEVDNNKVIVIEENSEEGFFPAVEILSTMESYINSVSEFQQFILEIGEQWIVLSSNRRDYSVVFQNINTLEKREAKSRGCVWSWC